MYRTVLWLRPTVSSPFGEQLTVEPVEVLRRKALERDVAEEREHMEANVALVGVERARPELRPLPGQPLLGEIEPEGDLLGGPVVAVVVPLDEFGDEPLGVALAGAG